MEHESDYIKGLKRRLDEGDSTLFDDDEAMAALAAAYPDGFEDSSNPAEEVPDLLSDSSHTEAAEAFVGQLMGNVPSAPVFTATVTNNTDGDTADGSEASSGGGGGTPGATTSDGNTSAPTAAATTATTTPAAGAPSEGAPANDSGAPAAAAAASTTDATPAAGTDAAPAGAEAAAGGAAAPPAATLLVTEAQKGKAVQTACAAGDLEKLKELVEEKGCPVDYNIKADGRIATHFAAAANAVPILEYLSSLPAAVTATALTGCVAESEVTGMPGLVTVPSVSAAPNAGAGAEGAAGGASNDAAAAAAAAADGSATTNPALAALLRAKDKCTGNTPMHIAAECGSTDVVLWLLEHGCAEDVGMKNWRGGYYPVHGAARNDRLETLKALVEVAGANARQPTGSGSTPLHFAAFNGSKRCFEYLVSPEVGAERDLLVKNKYGDLPKDRAEEGLQRCLAGEQARVSEVRDMVAAKTAALQDTETAIVAVLTVRARGAAGDFAEAEASVAAAKDAAAAAAAAAAARPVPVLPPATSTTSAPTPPPAATVEAPGSDGETKVVDGGDATAIEMGAPAAAEATAEAGAVGAAGSAGVGEAASVEAVDPVAAAAKAAQDAMQELEDRKGRRTVVADMPDDAARVLLGML